MLSLLLVVADPRALTLQAGHDETVLVHAAGKVASDFLSNTPTARHDVNLIEYAASICSRSESASVFCLLSDEFCSRQDCARAPRS